MTLPVLLHGGMSNAPQLLPGTKGSSLAVLTACLVDGFNTSTASSATAAGGVAAFNFATAPGFAALDTVVVEGASNAAANGRWRVQSAASNQVLIAMPGVPDGALGGTITLKFAPLGWTRPYTGTNLAAYRQGGSGNRRYLRVADSTSAADGRLYVRGYESMTGISVGTGPFPTTAEAAGNGQEWLAPIGGAGARPWLVVGTPKAFYFVRGYGGDYSGTPGTWPSTSGYAADCGASFYGDYDRPQKPGDAYALGLSKAYNWPANGLWGARAYTQGAGTRPAQDALSGAGYSANMLSGMAAYPGAASGGMTFVDAPLVAESFAGVSVVRGYLPGLVCGFEAPTNSGALPVGATLSNVAGITGRVVLASGYGGSGEFAVLLDEDWGDA